MFSLSNSTTSDAFSLWLFMFYLFFSGFLINKISTTLMIYSHFTICSVKSVFNRKN